MTLVLLNYLMSSNNECYALNIDDTDGSKRKKHPHWVAFGKYANSKFTKSFANLQNFADIDIVCNFTSSLLLVRQNICYRNQKKETILSTIQTMIFKIQTMTKVILYNSRGEVSLLEQDTIENIS